MVAEAQRLEDDEPSTSLAKRCSDLDLHRIDLTARLLALKDKALNPEALIVRTAVETRRSYERSLDAVLFIAGMIRISASMVSEDPARSLLAAERITDLMAALADPPAITYLRALRRRGQLDRPPPVDTQRLLRRACWRGRPHDARSPTHEPLPAAAWDALLDNLARSIAVDRESELQIDISLDSLDPVGLARRRDWVRAAIVHGEQVVSLHETSPTDVFDSSPVAGVGAGDGWSPPERNLLPAGHRIGRFTLLQKLGDGAMGVVYAAYDPELDRRIAVKLLRTRAGSGAVRAQARLLREAQAMARVAHPNVAVVHDVGTHDGDVFVAMEFVRGHTLQTWLKERTRSWQEVVAVFIQAGRGLAAAHAAGLIHRDFKPSNAMIGDDGRVRVLDFGLCYSESADDLADPSTVEITSDVRITRRGDIVGTPAYMPPEQYTRVGEVGPAADQFSFCASLYEALFDQLPFHGDTIHEVAASIARSEIRPPPRHSRVPAWLIAVVQRGLRSEPALRFPAMDALLLALDRTSNNRTRRGVALAAGFAALAGLGGFWVASSQAHEEDRCSGGALELAAVWGPDQRARAEQALAAAGPAFAEEVWPRVSADLDHYADAWRTAHRDACEAHHRGEHSGALLDRRMACLAGRKAALGEAITVLGSADVALHALEVATQLPALDRCADIVALESDVPPPADPAVRAQVEALRPRLARVATYDHAGQSLAALTLADEVIREAETIGERALLAEALLQRGRLEINRVDVPQEQDAVLTRAYLTALGGRLDEFAAEALALRMALRSRREGGSVKALEDLEVAHEMVARLPPRNHVHGLLLNNAGNVYMAVGDIVKAATMFREALAAREAALGPDHLDVAITRFNLAIVTPPGPERMQLVHRTLEILDQQLGPAHPQNLEIRLHSSHFALDPREAIALVAPACDTLARFTPDDHALRARCLAKRGHHAAESGDLATASAAFRDAEAQLDATDIPLLAKDLVALRGEAALYTDRSAAVLDSLRASIAPTISADEPWQRQQRADFELLLGQNLDRLADPSARDALAAAVADYEAAPSSAIPVLQRLAAARLALADHLDAHPSSPDDGTRATTLRALAEQWYRTAGDGYAWRLAARTNSADRAGAKL